MALAPGRAASAALACASPRLAMAASSASPWLAVARPARCAPAAAASTSSGPTRRGQAALAAGASEEPAFAQPARGRRASAAGGLAALHRHAPRDRSGPGVIASPSRRHRLPCHRHRSDARPAKPRRTAAARLRTARRDGAGWPGVASASSTRAVRPDRYGKERSAQRSRCRRHARRRSPPCRLRSGHPAKLLQRPRTPTSCPTRC